MRRANVAAFILAVGAALAAAGCDCGGGTRADAGSDAGTLDASPDGAILDGAPDDATVDGGTTEDGGCVIRCGPTAACCGAGQECVVDRCLEACAGSRCGDDTLCCGTDELCVGMMCVAPGAACDEESDCGEAQTCEPLVGRCVPIPAGAVCRYVPPSGVFEPELQWAYTDEQSLSMPLVIQLTDDNGDTRVDGRDVPDVVAITYASSSSFGHLTALSGDDGALLWQSSTEIPICGGTSPAAGDLDGDGTVEIVAILSASGNCGTGTLQRVAAFSHEGALEWESTTTVQTRYGSVAIANLSGDGSLDIVAGGSVFDAAGTFRWSQPELNDILGALGVNAPSIADVDLDGRMEVVASNVVFNDDGTLLWREGSVGQGFTAVARVVETASSMGPQIVSVNQTTLEVLDGVTGAVLFGPLTYESGGVLAGPPTVADFDGDGRPEIGVAGDDRYVVFDLDLPAPHVLWSVASEDSSTGSVGSTVFDFDADGSAEVLYADECHLRILSGMDGSVLWYASNTSVTAVEYPVVADVDSDGNAEVVVVSNSYSGSCGSRTLPFDGATQGVRVFRDRLDNWVPTRGVWNQHTYHLDNVRDDGAIPMSEARGWESHNTYRLNTLLDPDSVTLAPDLRVVAHDALVGSCPTVATLRARVENGGSRGVPAGVSVAFYAGEPPDRSAPLGVGVTTRVLLAGAGEWVEIEATSLPLDGDSSLRFYAVVDDDGTGDGAHSECDETNNAGISIAFDCAGPI